MRLKQWIILFLLTVSVFSYAAGPSDSIVSRKSLFIIPQASYQQETSVATGIAYGYYFRSKDISRISSVTGSAVYTFHNQFMFNVSPKVYFNTDKWYLYSNFSVRNYPDNFYGIGNKPTDFKQAFTARSISLVAQPQYILSKHLFVGVSFATRHEAVKTDSTFEKSKVALYNQFGSSGWEPFSQTSVGLVAAFDSRDNQFYPQQGFFAKTILSASKAGWGSTYSLQEVSIDCRQYIPVFESQVFAWQAYFAGIFGRKDIPFQLLPTVGGRDGLRGFRQGMYRENVLMMFQTEYRLPIYKRLKGAIFCSAGDVMSSSGYQIDKLKVAYGAGLRYRLNDARVHLRLDMAKNNYGDKLQFYITATEAF